MTKREGEDSNKDKGKKLRIDGDAPKPHACCVSGKPGHFKKDCTIWKKKMSKKKAQGGKGESS